MELDQGHGASALFQAQCHVYKHMYYYIESMALKCSVQLGIPDIIHNHTKPITLLELVSELNVPATKANCLQRLMRILVHSGFFATTKIDDNQGEDGYLLTPISRLLLKGGPINLSASVGGLVDPALITPWFSLSDWVHGNELTTFETFHGMSFGDYGKQNLEFFNSLNEVMACDSQLVSLFVRDHREIFERVDSIVDVGGGKGTLAGAIADACPTIMCTVLDLPHVVVNSPERKNLKFIGGDMFQSIPSADAILMKSVLHNWRDEQCIKILKGCREAIPSKDEGGKVILIEMVVDEKTNERELTETMLFSDMQMMLIGTGRERNEEEWKKLFLQAGFSHYKITPISGLNSIIEVYP